MHLLILTKSHIPAANIPTQIEILMEKSKYSVGNEPKPQLKRKRSFGSKDIIPRKMKSVKFNALEEHTNVKGLNDKIITPVKASIEQLSHEIVPVYNNKDIYIHIYIYIYILIIYIREKYGIEILPL